jgi:hypothetical protein
MANKKMSARSLTERDIWNETVV